MMIEKLQKLKALDVKIILKMIEAEESTASEMVSRLEADGIFLTEGMARRRMEKLVKIGLFGKRRKNVSMTLSKKIGTVYYIKKRYLNNEKFIREIKNIWEVFMNLKPAVR